VGVSGSVLEESTARRGEQSSRKVVGDFTYQAPAVVVTSGGIGANFETIRKNWSSWLGIPPKNMISGVKREVGSSIAIECGIIQKELKIGTPFGQNTVFIYLMATRLTALIPY